jgi:hypothetical protein
MIPTEGTGIDSTTGTVVDGGFAKKKGVTKGKSGPVEFLIGVRSLEYTGLSKTGVGPLFSGKKCSF